MLSSVVLPAPFGPITDSSSPRRTSRLTRLTAWTPPKCLETSPISSWATGLLPRTGSLLGKDALESNHRVAPRTGEHRRSLRHLDLVLEIANLLPPHLHDVRPLEPERLDPEARGHREGARDNERIEHAHHPDLVAGVCGDVHGFVRDGSIQREEFPGLALEGVGELQLIQ